MRAADNPESIELPSIAELRSFLAIQNCSADSKKYSVQPVDKMAARQNDFFGWSLAIILLSDKPVVNIPHNINDAAKVKQVILSLICPKLPFSVPWSLQSKTREHKRAFAASKANARAEELSYSPEDTKEAIVKLKESKMQITVTHTAAFVHLFRVPSGSFLLVRSFDIFSSITDTQGVLPSFSFFSSFSSKENSATNVKLRLPPLGVNSLCRR